MEETDGAAILAQEIINGVLQSGVTTIPHEDTTGKTENDHHTRSHAMTSTSDHIGGTWKVHYTDGDGAVNQLALGADGEVLTSSGAASLPAFEAAGGAGWNDPLTKTDDYTVTTDDFSLTIRMNATTAKTFTLPSVGSANDGSLIRLMNVGSGQLTITAADTDTIDESVATGSIINVAGDDFASVTLEYVHAITQWQIYAARGAWTVS